MEQGLPANWIECLFQSRDGFVWIGTPSGLVRFDGLEFVTFWSGNTPPFRNNVVKAISEDAAGRLWVATKKGALCLDAQGFHQLGVVGGLAGNETTSLSPGRDGGMWIGTEGGISRWKDGKIINFIPPPPNWPEDKRFIYSILEDRNGLVWAGREDGLWKLRPDSGEFERAWTMEFNRDDPQAAIVRCLFQDASGTLWFGTDHSLGGLREGQVSLLRIGDSSDDNRVKTIREITPGRIWAQTANGIWEAGLKGLKPLFPNDPFTARMPNCLLNDAEDNLWIGTRFGGLFKLTSTPLRVFTRADGLGSDNVISVQATSGGGVLAATKQGISKYRDGKWEPVMEKSVINSQGYRLAAEDRDGGRWFVEFSGRGTYLARGCNVCSGNEFTASGVGGLAFLEDSFDNVWFATGNGLVIRPNIPGMVFGSPENGLPDTWHLHQRNQIWAYESGDEYADFGGERWISQKGKRMHGMDPRQLERRNPFPEDQLDAQAPIIWGEKLSSYHLTSLLEDRKRRIWIGTRDGGINRVENRRVTRLGLTNGLPSRHVQTLFEDAAGVVWIGTDRGLAVHEDDQFKTVTQQAGLFDDDIHCVLEDDHGSFWISTPRGIFRARRDNLLAVVEGRQSRVHCLPFTEADGMLTAETQSSTQPAGCKTPDGKLWFPTPHGLVQIDPARFTPNEKPPRVVITHIQTASNPAPDPTTTFHEPGSGTGILPVQKAHMDRLEALSHHGKSPPGFMAPMRMRKQMEAPQGQPLTALDLPPGSGRSMEFRFAALSYTDPARNRYQYRLEGHDRDWIDADRRTTAHYTNLKPGRYHFRVRAANAHGFGSDADAVTAFVIRPFYYQSLWFQGGLIALAAGLAAYIHHHRLRRAEALHELQGQLAIEKERIRIARDIHDDLGSGLTQLNQLAALAKLDLAPDHPSATSVAKSERVLREMVNSMDEIV